MIAVRPASKWPNTILPTDRRPDESGLARSYCQIADHPQARRPADGKLDIRRRAGSTLARVDTGFPSQDAQTDFSRARRRQLLARLAMRLRRENDVDDILPFEEVTEALGHRGERSLGLQTIPL